jgi:hypothetical protein
MREQEADYDEYLRSLQRSSSDEEEEDEDDEDEDDEDDENEDDEDEDEDDEDEDDEDEDESTTSEMPTDTRGDAIVLSSDDTSQTLQPEQKGSDRAVEFDEETAWKRQAARDDAEEICAGQSGGELKRAPIEHEERDSRQEQGEENGEKDLAVEKPMEPKVERQMTPPRSQASWVSDAVAACKANTEVRLLKSYIARFQQC